MQQDSSRRICVVVATQNRLLCPARRCEDVKDPRDGRRLLLYCWK